jgi:hypothetical protein
MKPLDLYYEILYGNRKEVDGRKEKGKLNFPLHF